MTPGVAVLGAELERIPGEPRASAQNPAGEFVSFFRRWYGPALKAFEVLDDNGRAALAADLAHLARHWDRNHGGSIAIPATYLETILTLR